MEMDKVLRGRPVSISQRGLRGWRTLLPAAALACAMGGASPAFPMGDGLSPGLFDLPQGVGSRVLLACDTDSSFELNGCIACDDAEGCNEYLAVPTTTGGQLFWDNGQLREPNVVVRGVQAYGIVGKEIPNASPANSFDEVCITVDVSGGPPSDRGRQFCIEIVSAEDCPECTSPTCTTAVRVVSDPAFCTNVVLPELEKGYVINELAYVIDTDLARMGEQGQTTIRKCEGYVHRCTPVRDGVVIKGMRDVGGYSTPLSFGGYTFKK
jgi:hypothetical protein